MYFMNEHDVDDALMRWFDEDEQANLQHGAQVLYRLKEWTNRNSDGWAYWPKPMRAATKLATLLQEAHSSRDRADITEAQLKAAFTPIKSLLTRQKVDHKEVFLA